MKDCFDQVSEILFLSHAKTSDSRLDTLNRVFRKGVDRAGGSGDCLEELRRDNLVVELTARTPQNLLDMVTRPPRDPSQKHPKKVRFFFDVPVVVFAYAGREFLIDGNRRVFYLDEIKAPLVQVYLCRIR